MKYISLSSILIVLLLASCQQSADTTTQTHPITMQNDYPAPPVAAKKPTEFTEHGNKRTDNYAWLKDKKDPEVLKYLEAENHYADTVMKHTLALQDKLFQEMKSRVKEDDETVPVLDNGYYYFNRTEKDKQYAKHFRRKGSLTAPEELLIDENLMAEGKDYFQLASIDVAKDNKTMAYSFNYTGSYMEFDLHFKDLSTGKDLPDVLKNITDFVWANDSKTIFYTVVDKALRPYRVYKHELGTAIKGDKLIYEEKDELFNVGIGKSKTEDYIFISSESFTSSETRFMSADKPDDALKVFFPRTKDVQYEVNHHKDRFYITLKDNDHKNYQLLEAPLKGYEDRKAWKEVIPYDAKTKIEGIDVFEKYLVVSERNNGLLKIRVLDLANGKSNFVKFEEPTYTVYPSYTPEYTSATMRYTYTSLNRPTTVYEYDFTSIKSKTLKVQEVPGGFNPDEYEVKRIFAKATDGVEVPISLVYKKGLELNGKNPTLLYGYGSYGATTDPRFSIRIPSLLARGFVYAIAHIRGSGDLGEEWYEAGKMLNKKNTFTDFIACAEHLIKEKYTSPDKLAINGGSAGGLLMGAVTNMRPDLFKVVIAEVPFVDVINTMLDETLPLTTQEWEQWGNPKEKKYYDYMISYSPYDNIEKKNYPNILATGGINDSQVSFHEPAKYVAKLRELKTDNNLVLLKINMGAGHGGASGRFDSLKEEALQYAFILDRMGMAE